VTAKLAISIKLTKLPILKYLKTKKEEITTDTNTPLLVFANRIEKVKRNAVKLVIKKRGMDRKE
jgi:hypothetical protein